MKAYVETERLYVPAYHALPCVRLVWQEGNSVISEFFEVDVPMDIHEKVIGRVAYQTHTKPSKIRRLIRRAIERFEQGQ